MAEDDFEANFVRYLEEWQANSQARMAELAERSRELDLRQARLWMQARVSILESERNERRPPRPPGREERLVSLVCTPGQVDEILGDLEERFNKIAARDGEPAARRWYRTQAVQVVAWQLGRFAFWAAEKVANIAQAFIRLGS